MKRMGPWCPTDLCQMTILSAQREHLGKYRFATFTAEQNVSSLYFLRLQCTENVAVRALLKKFRRSCHVQKKIFSSHFRFFFNFMARRFSGKRRRPSKIDQRSDFLTSSRCRNFLSQRSVFRNKGCGKTLKRRSGSLAEEAKATLNLHPG